MPGSVSVGMPEKKASKAASPPAEAPMPTIGKLDFKEILPLWFHIRDFICFLQLLLLGGFYFLFSAGFLFFSHIKFSLAFLLS